MVSFNFLLPQSNLEIVNSRDYLKETISRSSIITVQPTLKVLIACRTYHPDASETLWFNPVVAGTNPQSPFRNLSSRSSSQEVSENFYSLRFSRSPVFRFSCSPFLLSSVFHLFDPIKLFSI